MFQFHVLFPISAFSGLCTSGVVWQNEKSLAAYQVYSPRVFSLSSMSESPVHFSKLVYLFGELQLYTEQMIL